jgi:hypothetical protein
MGKLTIHKVKALKASGFYGDGQNLVLAMRKGSGFWLFKYARHGREHTMGLGPLHTVDLYEARDAAHAARKLLREGRRDPIIEKGTKRALRIGSRTFEEVARDYHETKGRRWVANPDRIG